MNYNNNKIDMLFETSWEVCHKVGGIYTVLSTKAAVLHSQFADRLVFIGPDLWSESNPSPYFEADDTLLDGFSKSALLPAGISVKVGRWKIPSSPIAVLVGFQNEYAGLNTVFGFMWQKYKVDSLHAYGDYNEGCAFAVAAARVIAAITEHMHISPANVIAHYNEWTTGMGLLYTQTRWPEMSTLFTTHATSIGRSICSNGKPLYDYFEGYNGDQMAGELNMESKHSLEKAAAHAADCFTSVSELTARECKQLLGLRPQVVTPNGFEFQFVPAGPQYTAKRRKSRQQLLRIASALTGSPIPDDALLIATSGRHEYRNKGLDLFLDTLEYLRHKKENSERTIVAFIMVPGWVKEPAASLVDALKGESLAVYPNYLTHRLFNEDSDEIMVKLNQMNRNLDVNNLPIIYMPCYLDGKDGILDMDYYDMLPGLDLTVFPSYYEPWGYTPLESIAFGVPTVTTDKSGFGLWILDNFANSFASCGVRVIERTDSNYSEAVSSIGEDILQALHSTPAQTQKMRRAARATAKRADWQMFIKEYYRAFDVAQERRAIRLKNSNQ